MYKGARNGLRISYHASGSFDLFVITVFCFLFSFFLSTAPRVQCTQTVATTGRNGLLNLQENPIKNFLTATSARVIIVCTGTCSHQAPVRRRRWTADVGQLLAQVSCGLDQFHVYGCIPLWHSFSACVCTFFLEGGRCFQESQRTSRGLVHECDEISFLIVLFSVLMDHDTDSEWCLIAIMTFLLLSYCFLNRQVNEGKKNHLLFNDKILVLVNQNESLNLKNIFFFSLYSTEEVNLLLLSLRYVYLQHCTVRTMTEYFIFFPLTKYNLYDTDLVHWW